ncbi:MAG: hypothetical protein V4648_07315 [Bacteroidota bacterium]
MKKITLLVASILLVGNVANASEIQFTDDATSNRFSFDEPIAFTERGIEFFVFPNGDFDFNTRPDDSQGDYFFKGAGKRGNDKITNRGPVNYGTLIEHDSFGRVRRVGNTFINYDTRDRVSRIGTVYMKYNRFALTQIGGMRITYNRFGEMTNRIGEVKGRRSGFTNMPQNMHNTSYSYNTSSNYYYKTDGTQIKNEEEK